MLLLEGPFRVCLNYVITTNIHNLRAVTSWVKIISKSFHRIKSASIPNLVRAVMQLIFNVAIFMVLIGTVGGGGGVVVLG